MKLIKLVNKYIAYRKSIGEKFKTNEFYLKSFCKYVQNNIDIENIQMKQVIEFLYKNIPITSTWFCKYGALHGFFTYAISRGYTCISPLPKTFPKKPPTLIPYIYTKDELRQLLQTALTYQKKQSHVKPYMIHKLILLLYVTGLRLGEALSLTMADVDLSLSIITVRISKFNKSRLVPFDCQFATVIREYINWRKIQGFPQNEDSFFFYGRNNKSLNKSTVQDAFQKILKKAKIQRTDNARYQPRLHDLRHTFAVHRIVSWYREGANVQQLLPALSVYMGHTALASTSTYLTFTKELLQEAGELFEKYTRKKH